MTPTQRPITHYPVTPIGKPRMTRRDKWAKRECVQRYWSFCDRVRALSIELPESCTHIKFYIPMPASWSAKKKKAMYMTPHRQTPDLDNLIKALCDAVHKQDCAIHDYRASKIWSFNGGITIKTLDDIKWPTDYRS